MPSIWLEEGRRSSVRIAAAVLRLSNSKDTTKSELVKCVKMSNQQTQKYLDWLVELDLLNVFNGGNNRFRYRSTQKGQTLVSVVDEVQRMLASRYPGANGPPEL
jgi:predicted transcriptional regulator